MISLIFLWFGWLLFFASIILAATKPVSGGDNLSNATYLLGLAIFFYVASHDVKKRAR
jgi:hypothetical protein